MRSAPIPSRRALPPPSSPRPPLQLRLVVLSADGTLNVDAPLLSMHGECFRQPIFGANNLAMKVHPMAGTTLTEDVQLTVYFRNGGTGTFLPLFIDVLSRIRATESGVPAASLFDAAPASDQQYVDDRLSTAYLDPHDPTTLFVVEDDRSADRGASAPNL